MVGRRFRGGGDAGEGEGAPRSATTDGVGGTQSSRVPNRRNYGPFVTPQLFVGGRYFPSARIERDRRPACSGAGCRVGGRPLRARSRPERQPSSVRSSAA